MTLIDEWDRGICSTKPDNDYVHLVQSAMADLYANGECVKYAYNFATWERADDRDSMLKLIDEYLDEKVDLVTIQLGENVSDVSTYQEDMESLISFVQVKAPNAKIIVIGDFWSAQRNELRKMAAMNKNISFADLSEIRGVVEYQSEAGMICYMIDGTTQTVTSKMAAHPGDKGMVYIAEQVISEYQKAINQ